MPIQQYHDKNKLIFNEMMMRSTLHYTNLDFYSGSSLKQQSAPLGHIIPIPSQPVFALFP